MQKVLRRVAARRSAIAPSLGMICALSFGLMPAARFAAAQASVPLVFRNPDLSAEERAADIVSRLTLQEKTLQMQNSAPAIPRLGIPAYNWWSEALHGVARAGLATVFPQAIGLAATWDTNLMGRVGDAIATEARAKYNEDHRKDNPESARYHGLTFWSPNINIFRDPRWGRGQETYGEDPFLTSQMAVAFIRGMQGDDPRYLKTIATPKHFAVHSGPEPSRHSVDIHPSVRDLEETYLPAFKASITEGKAGSIMCAYNRVDQFPACANAGLLQDHLRTAWGFTGYVVSDCGAIDDFVSGHKFKATTPEAAAAGVKAGTDLTCGEEYASLVDAVKLGLITEEEIDRSLRRLFIARIRLGLFDPPDRTPYTSIPASQIDSEDHRQLALRAARESIVLLQNDKQFLPFKKETRRIAVLGPAADDPDTMLANYHGTPSHIVTPLAGMKQQFGASQIRFAQGSTFTVASNALVPTEVLTPSNYATGKPTEVSVHGLLAEYFSNADLQGSPHVSRVEPRIYLQREMGDEELDKAIARDHYSVRWSGLLRAPYSGEFRIDLVRRCEDCEADDAARVYLDDKIMVDDDSHAPPRAADAPIHLKKGRDYRLRVEYRHRAGNLAIQLVWRPPVAPLLTEAIEAVKKSDAAVVFVGLNSQLEGEEMKLDVPGFSGGDRTSIDLPEPQERLLEVAIKTGKPVVVVLISGSALAANYAAAHSSALLEAWYGGEEGGTAIAQTLAGENNPAGRLPVTYYRSVNQLPAFENYAMRGRTYRYFTGPPLYTFGFGLSYSRFRYSDLQVEPESANHKEIHVSVQLENMSPLGADEVVQLYVGRENSAADDPIRELRGLQRIHLSPGESRRVQFELPAPRATIDESNPIRANGHLHISVGGGQPGSGMPFVENIF